MSVKHLLQQLASLDVKLWVDDQRLRYSAPPGAMTDKLREQLASHKAEVISLLEQLRGGTDGLAPILK
jgi:hypothetical protein